MTWPGREDDGGAERRGAWAAQRSREPLAKRVSPLTAAAGLRHTDFTTQYPSQFTTACSFDRDLVREMTERMSAEFAGKGVNVQLGPVSCETWLQLTAAHWRAFGAIVRQQSDYANRRPYCGRNWEGESALLMSAARCCVHLHPSPRLFPDSHSHQPSRPTRISPQHCRTSRSARRSRLASSHAPSTTSCTSKRLCAQARLTTTDSQRTATKYP